MKKHLLFISIFLSTVVLAQPLPESVPGETETGTETELLTGYTEGYEIDPVDSTLEQKQPTFDNVMILAFKTGNAATIASYFSSNVDMSIDEKENLYSDKQGQQVLKNFFDTHKPNDFSIIHKGKTGQSEYIIGELETSGKTYRVTINTKAVGSKKEITSLTIEEN